MAYSTIDKFTAHFNTKLYAGTGSSNSQTGVGFQPDWTWIKSRNNGTSNNHMLFDAVRGATKYIKSDQNSAQNTLAETLKTFDSDGFTVGTQGDVNTNSINFVSWNWKAGGTAPAITYTVKVVSDSGNKYRFDDFGTSAVTLDLQEGGTYTFDQSDSSNSGHPLRFSTTSNGTHGGGSEYTTGVTTTGTPGSSGAKTVITVASGAPTLYYYCTQHSGMGGQANTNSLFGSSNFSGSIQSTVSLNTTSGFSIVKWTGTGSSGTIGHGLGAKPDIIFAKRLGSSTNWAVYYNFVDGSNDYFKLNATDAKADSSASLPTSSVFSKSDTNSEEVIAYCFTSKTGYSKIGNYIGNNNSDGAFVYTGFKPAFVMIKYTGSGQNWIIIDNKRPGYNLISAGDSQNLRPNTSDAEVTSNGIDLLSNGFKCRSSDGDSNGYTNPYVYMAFGQTMVGSNDIPATAR